MAADSTDIAGHENATEDAEKKITIAPECSSKDSNIVDWDGPDDPQNPLNWSTSRKVAALGTVSLITVLS